MNTDELTDFIFRAFEPFVQYLEYLPIALVVILLFFVLRIRGYVLRIGLDLEKSLGHRLGEIESGLGERLGELQRSSMQTKNIIRQGIKDELGDGLTDVIGDFFERARNQSGQAADEIKIMREELNNIKALLEQQGVYIHDNLAELTAKEEERMRQVQERLAALLAEKPDGAGADKLQEGLNGVKELIEKLAVSAPRDDEKMRQLQDGLSARLAEQGREERALMQEALRHSAQLVSEAINRLSAEVDAKLAQLVDKAGNNFADRLAQTMESFGTLQKQMNELIDANKEMESMSRDITSLSRLMMARSGHTQETRVSDLLAAWLPGDAYAINVRMNDLTISALLYLPGSEGATALDAGLTLTDMEVLLRDSGDSEAQAAVRRRFGKTLHERIRYVADTHISPPTTADSALLFIASEAAFAEIQAYHGEALAFAASRRVWLTSPTTLAAALNIARTAIRDYQSQQSLKKMQTALQGIVQEAQQFENRLLEIGDHVNNAMRSVQRAESAGVKLFGRVRGVVGEEEEQAPPAIADRTTGKAA